MKLDLKMTRGDTKAFSIVTDGVDADAVYMTARPSIAPQGNLFQLSLDDGITESDGVYSFRIAPNLTFNAVPGMYSYDIEFTIGSDVYTPFKGILNIEYDVTHILPEEVDDNADV